MGLVKFSSSSLPILVDASFLVCVYDKHEPYHRQCMAVLDQVNQPLVTCEPVVTEAIYLLRRLPGAPQTILASIQEGQLEIPFQLADGVHKVLSYYTNTATRRPILQTPASSPWPTNSTPAIFSPSTAILLIIAGGGPQLPPVDSSGLNRCLLAANPEAARLPERSGAL